MHKITDLRKTLIDLCADKKTLFNAVYEHDAPFGELSLSDNNLAATYAQLGMIVGAGKKCEPLTYYDNNLTTLTNGKKYFSCSIAALYVKQFNLVLSKLYRDKYATFYFASRYQTQQTKNFFNKVRLLSVDLTLDKNKLLIRVMFLPANVFPGFILDLAQLDILIEEFRSKLRKKLQHDIHVTTTFHFPKLTGNWRGIKTEGFSGLKKSINVSEAEELIKLEEHIRARNLKIPPSSLLPLNEECLSYLREVVEFTQKQQEKYNEQENIGDTRNNTGNNGESIGDDIGESIGDSIGDTKNSAERIDDRENKPTRDGETTLEVVEPQ